MTTYTLFKLRHAEFFPNEEQRQQMERIFAGVRSLHNLFVVTHTNLADEEVARLSMNYKYLKEELIDTIDKYADDFGYIVGLSPSVIETHLRIIEKSWTDFKLGKRIRPETKEAVARQCFWNGKIDGIKVENDTLYLDGDKPLVVNIGPWDWQGSGPTIYRVTKTARDRYWFTALYETVSDTPDESYDKMVSIWSATLREMKYTFRKNGRLAMCDDERSMREDARAYYIRRSVLARLAIH